MPYLNIGDIQVYYEEAGAGSPLLLLHGGTGAIDGQRGWGRLRPVLSKQHRLFLVELRGHGRTNNPRKDLSYPTIADDVRAFLGRLDCAPVHCAGIGDGGVVSLHLALSSPELLRSVICVGTHCSLDLPAKTFLQAETPELIEHSQPAWLTEMVQLHDTNKWPGYWRLLQKQVNENQLRGTNLAVEDLARITLPTLLIAGENDPVATPDQIFAMRKALPKGEMLLINNAGRAVQFTHRELVGPVVLDFLLRNA
jgi:pimeloyl-ACP methyl ester carboxylesterase